MIGVGDVVYCAGASAIHGDVVAHVDGGLLVRWRETYTVEIVDDLVCVQSAVSPSAVLLTPAMVEQLIDDPPVLAATLRDLAGDRGLLARTI